MKRTIGLILLLVLSSCGRSPDGPPEIHPEMDSCEECSMIISQPRFAAGYHSENGTPVLFDDVGCLMKHWKRQETKPEVSKLWVRDFETDEWIRASGAVFTHRDDVTTPMGYGILTFSEGNEPKESPSQTFLQITPKLDENIVEVEI